MRIRLASAPSYASSPALLVPAVLLTLFVAFQAPALKAGEDDFGYPPREYEYHREANVMVPMRDGVKLATDIYSPVGLEEKLPVILIRTPFSKFARPPIYARFFARRGYVVAVQDVRGRFMSEGHFTILANDADDGYDTMTWLADQPWCNGRIGTFGCSYMGECQIVLAKERHPNHITMICQGAGGAIGTAGDRYTYGSFYRGGAFALSDGFSWMVSVGSRDKTERTSYRYGSEDLSTLPLVGMITRHGGPHTDWEDYLTHDLADSWWTDIGYVTDTDSFYVPALHMTSWFDYGVGEALYLFDLMERNAGTQVARDNQFMIVTPMDDCNHEAARPNTIVGRLRLGDARFPCWRIYLDWFDYWLKGKENGITERPRVQIYVMGRNAWRHEEEWPLAGAEYVPYYLHGSGNARSIYGDGTLTVDRPLEEPEDRFTYDPENPVPGPPPVPVDQIEVEKRTDVLVYTSPPLEDGIEVTGHIKTVLFVSSSAVDTDFTAKLVDVQPDGSALNIQSGMLRARYREGFDRKVWMQPGEVYRIEIDLHATSYYFGPGHQIRLEVSSSSFPQFDRNLNTGGNNYDETTWVVARNAVHHSSQYPSRIVLPVVR